jgi:hypothetical protein
MDDQPKLTFIQRIFRSVRLHFFLWILIIVAIVILALGFEAGRYSVYNAHPEFAGADQASAILAKVGTLIQLPAGETPTMATINDAASAKQAQPFLVSAQNGDILIVYPNAAVAILYRPSTNKVIVEGPVNTGTGGQGTEQLQNSPAPAATTTNATTTKSKK